MPATGQRGRTPVSPMNRTGKIFQQQLRDKQANDAAKEEAVNFDVETTRAEAFAKGYNRGFENGKGSGQEICARVLMGLYQDEGIEAVENLLKEWIAADDADETGEDK